MVLEYILCLCYPYLGKKIFIGLTWLICIVVKVTSEIYEGYNIDFINGEIIIRNKPGKNMLKMNLYYGKIFFNLLC